MTYSAEQARAGLEMIVDYMDRGNLGRVELYELIAKKLSAIAQRSGKPWGWRYVRGVLAGTTEAGEDFGRAIAALGANLDDVPICAAYTVQVTVLARPNAVPPGTLILGEARPCEWPSGCSVTFVPRTWNQKYCSRALHAAADRERRKEIRNG